ncbi:MAG TPA: saccharopine dehydrogenase [Bacteroidetes bacterium]|nr:saccharopine dehydrogenase [Bacteroidota bacterium]
MKILIYGCYGYTGQLIAAEAAAQHLPVQLCGRNAAKVQAVAEATGLPGSTAALDDAVALDAILREVAVVIHCAGPFVDTWSAMTEACLRTGTHYLDITGEVEVFEALAGLDSRAKGAGIMLMPGAGFDVVPTDCVAASLKRALPDATDLELAIHAVGGGVSHGTASTLVRSLGKGSLRRQNGQLIASPLGKPVFSADFGRGPQPAFGIPWGDVSTAWYTTGIPNISTGIALPKGKGRLLAISNAFGWLLRRKWVHRLAQRRIDAQPAGPNAATRAAGKSLVWGRAFNSSGQEVQMNVSCPDGYTLTAKAALYLAQQVLADNWKAGFQTPAGYFGADLLEKIAPKATIQRIS